MKEYLEIKNKGLKGVKGIGPKTEEALFRSGIFSAFDLLNFLPREYLDYTKTVSVSDLRQGEACILRLKILTDAKTVRVHGLTITSAMASDGHDNVRLSWYNQPYRASSVHRDDIRHVYGKADVRKGKCIINPSVSDTLPGILTVYPRIADVKSSTLKKSIQELITTQNCLPDDFMPEAIRKEYGLIPLAEAYRKIHMPESFLDVEKAQKRLDFERFLIYFLNVEMQRQERHRGIGFAFSDQNSLEDYPKLLPFTLTCAQLRVMSEIRDDMMRSVPMNRMVQGDVGSGKTAVAMYAMYLANKNGKQVVLLAPTEVLARQHYETVSGIFKNTVLLTGGLGRNERGECLEKIANGSAGIVIGTHALLQGDVRFSDLALVITDEQHRFGVAQRSKMEQKGIRPDVLVMSATPIPRTLALLLYGDLDLSCIDSMPVGRKQIKTSYIPPKRREEMYDYLIDRAKEGRQVYVVCPYIDSDSEQETMNVSDVYYELKKRYRDISVSMLHGRMKQDEKESIMKRFRDGEIQVLVTTTVIEVGVDVKNAVYMVIEDADRFGLAQLHQLRGRVGRGDEQSYCFLLSNSESENAKIRIQTICGTSDGFKISETDLKMRGAGDFIGTRQHGEVSDSFLEYSMDEKRIAEVRKAAKEIIEIPNVQNSEYLDMAMERYSQFHDRITMN